MTLPLALLLVTGGFLFTLEIGGYVIPAGFKVLLFLVAALVVFFWRGHPVRLGLGVGAILLVHGLKFGETSYVVHSERNFFGVIQVTRTLFPASHVMTHGSTTHGKQWLIPGHRDRPLTYFHPTGPLGQVFEALAEKGDTREIGITGLGTGTIACYGEANQRITYYEIDPAVERAARNIEYFTYLADCKSEVKVKLGDARLNLAKEPDGLFDLLILDAFGSDSLPVHLITHQAVSLYLDKLAQNGILAFNISNRYLDMEPILGPIAEDLGMVCRCNHDLELSGEEIADGKLASIWVVMARHSEDLGKLVDNPAWKPIEADPDAPVWTDDFCNILSVLKW